MMDKFDFSFGRHAIDELPRVYKMICGYFALHQEAFLPTALVVDAGSPSMKYSVLAMSFSVLHFAIVAAIFVDIYNVIKGLIGLALLGFLEFTFEVAVLTQDGIEFRGYEEDVVAIEMERPTIVFGRLPI